MLTYTKVMTTFNSYMLWAIKGVSNAATIQTPQTCRLCERKRNTLLYNTIWEPAAGYMSAGLNADLSVTGDG
jgi:hypothetical protein